MDKVRELNAKLGDKVQPYRKLTTSKVKIVNENLFYFLLVGIGSAVVSIILGMPSTDTSGTGSTNVLVSFFLLILALGIIVGLTSWSINLYRTLAELVANKGIKITKTSFIPDFDESFFKRGIKYLVSSSVLGVIVGLIMVIPLLFIIASVGFGVGGILAGTFASSETALLTLLFGGVVGFLAVFLLVFFITLALALLLSPFILPLQTLYVFYGDDIGVFEAISLSMSLGRKNYKLLLVTSLKIAGLNILGVLAFGIGILYTAPLGMLIELDAVSSILGISLAEGKTFKEEGIVGYSQEPKVHSPQSKTVTEKPVAKEQPIEQEELNSLEDSGELGIERDDEVNPREREDELGLQDDNKTE